jgi:hypothetical protein
MDAACFPVELWTPTMSEITALLQLVYDDDDDDDQKYTHSSCEIVTDISYTFAIKQ